MERQRCFEKNASLRGSILSVATPRREEGVGSIMYKMHWTSIGRHGKHAKKLPSTREAITPSRSSDVKNRSGKKLGASVGVKAAVRYNDLLKFKGLSRYFIR